MKIIFRLLKRVLFLVLLVAALLLAGLKVAGFKPYVIETQSMEPDYPVNTLVYVHSIDFNMLSVGDVITYTNQSNSAVTHRIVSINKDENLLHTKGDANEFEDIMPVYSENIIGKVYFKIPYIGKLSSEITQRLVELYSERSDLVE